MDWTKLKARLPGGRAGAALALAGAFIAAFLAWPEGWLFQASPQEQSLFFARYVSQGTALLHGLWPPDSARMPLFGAASLLAGSAAAGELRVLWLLLSLCLCLLGYALGALLAGRAAGAAAAAALFLGRDLVFFFDFEQRFYLLTLAATACALANPRLSAPARGAAFGLAAGISFLARATLCWLPPLLAAAELAGLSGRAAKGRLAGAALALTLPFLLLLPWVRFTSASGRTALFNGGAEWNMVTGAMGVVTSFEGDYRALAGIPEGENATLWAAKRIVSRPGEYAAGVAKRTAALALEHPFSLAFWLAALLLRLGSAPFRRVNLLLAYFLGLHLAFSYDSRYLEHPLLLANAVSAAALLGYFFPGSENPPEAAPAMYCGALPLAALALFCMALLLSHPGRRPGRDNLAATRSALESRPDSPWLLARLGRQLLVKGDPAGAWEALGRAMVICPHDHFIRMDAGLAAALRNRRAGRPLPGGDLLPRLGLEGRDLPDYAAGRAQLLLALYRLHNGERRKAAEHVRLAAGYRLRGVSFKSGADSAGLDKARSLDTALLSRDLPEQLAYFPWADQPALCRGFTSLYAQSGLPLPPGAPGCEAILQAAAEYGRLQL